MRIKYGVKNVEKSTFLLKNAYMKFEIYGKIFENLKKVDGLRLTIIK